MVRLFTIGRAPLVKKNFIPLTCQHVSLQPPVRDAVVIRYIEHEIQLDGTQRTFAITDFDVQPLDYDCLAGAIRRPDVNIPLQIWNGKIVDRNFGDTSVKLYLNAFSPELDSHFTSKAIGLVRGGWLPSALAATRDNSAVILDRNVIGTITHYLEAGAPRGRKPDFLELFAGRPILISPVICALEGNGRCLPDHVDAISQLMEVGNKLRRALPDARVLDAPEIAARLGLFIDGYREQIERGQGFLLELAPQLSPVGKARRSAFWANVMDAADRHGVPRRSLLVLAVLSAGLMPNGSCPARSVLKPSPVYSGGDAFNAMLDLTALDVLIRGIANLPDHRIQLCTGDKGLALFWCGIQASDFRVEGASCIYSLTPNHAVLPDDLVEEWFERTK